MSKSLLNQQTFQKDRMRFNAWSLIWKISANSSEGGKTDRHVGHSLLAWTTKTISVPCSTSASAGMEATPILLHSTNRKSSPSLLVLIRKGPKPVTLVLIWRPQGAVVWPHPPTLEVTREHIHFHQGQEAEKPQLSYFLLCVGPGPPSQKKPSTSRSLKVTDWQIPHPSSVWLTNTEATLSGTEACPTSPMLMGMSMEHDAFFSLIERHINKSGIDETRVTTATKEAHLIRSSNWNTLVIKINVHLTLE